MDQTGQNQKEVMDRRIALRKSLVHAMIVAKQESEEIYKRQVEEDIDPFNPYYTPIGSVLKPPFSFANLYKIFEEGDVLASCVDAMKENVDGFGYQMHYLGDDQDLPDDKVAQKEQTKAENFFDYVNEEQSIITIRKLAREDLEILGNGAFEVVRNRVAVPQMMFHMPFRRLRITRLHKDPVRMEVPMLRDGKVVQIKIKKYFHRYCQVSAITGLKLKWFKEFGDPRIMDSKTGAFVNSRSEASGEVASEILHFKIPFGDSPYGIPRWIQTVLDVRGRRNSQYVNYDLFDSQGIPPLVIMVTGGYLTDDSMEMIETVFRSGRGADKFNRIMLLEANPETTGLEDKGTAKIDLKPMAEYRKEDQMFTKYLDQAAESIRHRFRLPPLYVGWASTFTHATSKSAKEVAEEQIFIPERFAFDEIMNRKILPPLGITKWLFKTKGPQIVGSEEISSGVGTFNEAGAFTVNHAIAMANSAFGLQMSKFKEDWANYPYPIVFELAKRGALKGLDKIEDVEKGQPAPLAAPPVKVTGAGVPLGTPSNVLPFKGKGKVKKEDLEKLVSSFTDKEKGMYLRLKALQEIVELAEVSNG